MNCVPLWQQRKAVFEISKCFDKWFVPTVVMKKKWPLTAEN